MQIKRILVPKKVEKKEKKEKFYIKDHADIHTHAGVVKKDALKEGEVIKSHMGKEYYFVPANFKDNFENIKRDAQIITPKDFGAIIANAAITKDSIIVEAGTGSGGLSCMLASVAKEVYSFDVSDKAVKIGEQNAKTLGLKNVKFEVCNLKENAPKKEVDVVILDMPGSEDAIDSAFKMLKVGGYLVGYFPQITQAYDFAGRLKDNFFVERVLETIERDWQIADRVCRPKFLIQGHTAFLLFARKAKK